MGRSKKSSPTYLHRRADTGDFVYLKAIPARFRPYLVGEIRLGAAQLRSQRAGDHQDQLGHG
jgi:hypothetical protein